MGWISVLFSFLGAAMGGVIGNLVLMDRKIHNGSIMEKRKIYEIVSSKLTKATFLNKYNLESETNSKLYLYASDNILDLIKNLNNSSDEAKFSEIKEKIMMEMRKELKVKI
ncbi:MAG: hypothetical protein ACK5L3_13705 [Oscillospiraceae bacterium]